MDQLIRIILEESKLRRGITSINRSSRKREGLCHMREKEKCKVLIKEIL